MLLLLLLLLWQYNRDEGQDFASRSTFIPQ
jgi:hypothetical protein